MRAAGLGLILALAACGLTNAATDSAAVNAPDPVAVIRAKDVELQKLLRDTTAAKKKTDRLKVLINGIFDFEELGRKALGQTTWGKTPAPQQTRFVKAFKEMVENSSVKKLEAYVSDSTRYEAPEKNGVKASVTAHVFSKGAESIILYKLQYKTEGWKAWDLVIDDLSTAGNYGEQFKKILQKSDMEGLISKLEAKTKSGAAPKTADNVKAKSEKTSKDAAVKKTATGS